MWEGIVGLLFMGWLIYAWLTYPYRHWKDKGFPYLQAHFPFGNSKGLVLMDQYQGYALQDMYRQMGNEPYAGIILLRRPHLLLKDTDVIKAIMLKDFVHFTDRIESERLQDPLSHHLFNLGGDKWKALRVKLSPTFTSGKLKLMFPLFEMCSRNLEDQLQKLSTSNQEVEVKDIMGRFTTKIVGTCAYGIDIDSLGDESNIFVKITKKMFPLGYRFKRKLTTIMSLLFPGVENVYRARVVPKNMEYFFRKIVLDTTTHRLETGIKRNDFIDLLTEIRNVGEIKLDSIDQRDDEANKTTSINITDDDLVAQVLIFLAAGFETSSSVTSYCLFELAENQEIQEKLRKEIKDGQPLSYQSIHDMKYLDMVVHETIRKYPTLPFLSRKCTKQYRMPNGEILEKGTRVLIPTYALQHDPKYFPEPNKFDPERFTQENKNTRPQFSYLPFGEGPRLCIGMRFGLLQTKMGIATILSKYRVEKTENTVSPLQFLATPLISQVNHPIRLYFKPI